MYGIIAFKEKRRDKEDDCKESDVLK